MTFRFLAARCSPEEYAVKAPAFSRAICGHPKPPSYAEALVEYARDAILHGVAVEISRLPSQPDAAAYSLSRWRGFCHVATSRGAEFGRRMNIARCDAQAEYESALHWGAI